MHRGTGTDVFPHLKTNNLTGIDVFTATSLGQLLNPKRMPENLPAPAAAYCYRFVLTNPPVDIWFTGTKTPEPGPMN